ncbi:reverse transcriptase domain-containing protein [Tanacetum coccineum]
MVKGKREQNRSLALKAKKESSDEDSSTYDSEDEEYAMAVRDLREREGGGIFQTRGKICREKPQHGKESHPKEIKMTKMAKAKGNALKLKFDDALWAFKTAYKTPTGTTPYKLLYGKNCHLPFEIEHRAYWALKNCNPDLIAAGSLEDSFETHRSAIKDDAEIDYGSKDDNHQSDHGHVNEGDITWLSTNEEQKANEDDDC